MGAAINVPGHPREWKIDGFRLVQDAGDEHVDLSLVCHGFPGIAWHEKWRSVDGGFLSFIWTITNVT